MSITDIVILILTYEGANALAFGLGASLVLITALKERDDCEGHSDTANDCCDSYSDIKSFFKFLVFILVFLIINQVTFGFTLLRITG